jgi:hypothetical protein
MEREALEQLELCKVELNTVWLEGYEMAGTDQAEQDGDCRAGSHDQAEQDTSMPGPGTTTTSAADTQTVTQSPTITGAAVRYVNSPIKSNFEQELTYHN